MWGIPEMNYQKLAQQCKLDHSNMLPVHEMSKTSDWFENTIFIFTADHSNQTHFPFYEKTVNRFANPLMIFKSNSELKGVDTKLASHLDIFPTVADLIDYPKPFKSWRTRISRTRSGGSCVGRGFLL